MRLYLATENAGKVREMKALLSAALPHLQVLSVSDLTADQRERYQADETGTTYEENALIKAQALAPLVEGFEPARAQTPSVAARAPTHPWILADAQMPSVAASALIHPWILAEDSGFEVEALGGAPGVYSARYAENDAARCAKILSALQGQPAEKRRAQFVACMVLLRAGENPTFFFGRKEGYIADAARGDQGFGYDPIFCPMPGGPTWGEMNAAEKSRDSHRSRALDLLIRSLLGDVKDNTLYPL